jgi:hypothetical protein
MFKKATEEFLTDNQVVFTLSFSWDQASCDKAVKQAMSAAPQLLHSGAVQRSELNLALR